MNIPKLFRALAVGLNAAADNLDEDSGPAAVAVPIGSPRPGSPESQAIVLSGIEEINREYKRGATIDETRRILADAGLDMRGVAGFHTPVSHQLELRDDGRWITDAGRNRLAHILSHLEGVTTQIR